MKKGTFATVVKQYDQMRKVSVMNCWSEVLAACLADVLLGFFIALIPTFAMLVIVRLAVEAFGWAGPIDSDIALVVYTFFSIPVTQIVFALRWFRANPERFTWNLLEIVPLSKRKKEAISKKITESLRYAKTNWATERDFEGYLGKSFSSYRPSMRTLSFHYGRMDKTASLSDTGCLPILDKIEGKWGPVALHTIKRKVPEKLAFTMAAMPRSINHQMVDVRLFSMRQLRTNKEWHFLVNPCIPQWGWKFDSLTKAIARQVAIEKMEGAIKAGTPVVMDTLSRDFFKGVDLAKYFQRGISPEIDNALSDIEKSLAGIM